MPKKKKPAETAPKEPENKHIIRHHGFFRFGDQAIGLVIYEDFNVRITLYTGNEVLSRTICLKGE